MQDHRRNSWGFAIFCDDIRHEVGNKISLAGIYQNELILTGEQVPPTILPKLAILIMYYEVAGAISGRVTFKLSYQGENPASIEQDMPEIKMERPATLPDFQDGQIRPSDDEGERILHSRVPIILSPFVVRATQGLLKVRAHYEDGTFLRLGSLRLLGPAVTEAASTNPSAS